MKYFSIPEFYKSSIISFVKEIRKNHDPRKKDYSPTLLDFGPIRFYIARHFGFCYGVENAIEISFKAIEENPGKRIFLLSQMIHNPDVNHDLTSRGIQFLMDTSGNQLIPFETLNKEDIVIIPAFGTTIALEEKLRSLGIEVHQYNTTCPFVERVWKKAEKLGESNYTVIIHGKHHHEETRATFSRSEIHSPSIIIKNMREAIKLGEYMLGKSTLEEFNTFFSERVSAYFNPEKDLQRIGVINQTTMLATETQEIANYFKQVITQKHGAEKIAQHFADTRDTLCYATNENQESTLALLKTKADIALVVGGYNSSNTSHIVELCEQKFPTYYISSEKEIISNEQIRHFNFHTQQFHTSNSFLHYHSPITIILTAGASCPDAIIEKVMLKLVSFYPNTFSPKDVLEKISKSFVARFNA
jgi:4-hydroxy-3-methylbut-2-en-1-yl diphosphate reductase